MERGIKQEYDGISIVIRNRNQAEDLERTLNILTRLYSDDIDEIILIDNQSADNSREVALNYGCRICEIVDFTYGKAINMGINESRSPYVLLLSSHVVPVGERFFKITKEFLKSQSDLAGIRYVNNFEDIERCVENNNTIPAPLDYGLMAACSLVSKEVWRKAPFDEDLIFSEDKEWSVRVKSFGYQVYVLNETYFYYLKRNVKSSIKRFKAETMVHYQLRGWKYMSVFRIFLSLLYKLLVKNNVAYFQTIIKDFKIFKAKLEINKSLNSK